MNKKELTKIKEAKLSHKKVIELFEYNSDTGVLTNRINRGPCAKSGQKAGCQQKDGYLRVALGGCGYQVHRLVWFYMFKKWPVDQIDHINRIKNDNRICNLREATASINMLNRPQEAKRRSGIEGILWKERDKSWAISYNGKNLGHALTIKEGIQFQKEESEGIFKRRPPRKGTDSLPQQSGIEGVTWNKKGSNWIITHQGKYLCLSKTIKDGIKFQKQASNGTFIRKDRVKAFNQSGIEGIIWHKKTKSWQVSHKSKYIGVRKTLSEALLLKLESANGEHIKGLKELYTIPA